MIAALFVETGGCYFGLPEVDPWDRERDARLYPGPHPVICHPPCERWGRFATWHGGKLGDDDGCFAAALRSVQRWGGVIEHPAGSKAWRHFGLPKPRVTGWRHDFTGWVCSVEQGHYGHPARKETWLFYDGYGEPPELIWGPSPQRLPARADRAVHPGRLPEGRNGFGLFRRCRYNRAGRRSAWPRRHPDRDERRICGDGEAPHSWRCPALFRCAAARSCQGVRGMIYQSRSERGSRGWSARPAAGSGVRLPAVTICSRQPSRVQPRDYPSDQLADWRPVSILLPRALHVDQHGMEMMRELAQVVREQANVVHG